MQYIFEKSILTELTSGGCKRSVINRLEKNWRAFCAEQRIAGEDYVINKLGLKHEMIPDKPPLARYTEEGKAAEISLIDELSYFERIGTDLKEPSKISSYLDFKESAPGCAQLVFENSNRKFIKINKATFDNEDFEIDFSDKIKVDKARFLSLFDPTRYKYVYQFKFPVEKDFYFSLIKDASTLSKLKLYNISFRNSVPDLIKIIESSTNCLVFDSNYNVVNSSPNKIKLQVCDIKMAEFTNKFFIELGLYMLALNSFVFDNGLNDRFEVVAEGVILPRRNNESDAEKEERLKSSGYKLEQWVCQYSTIRDKILLIFNRHILDVISIIESGNKAEYDKFKVTHQCQTCDNYGGQYSEGLKKYIKQYNSTNGTTYSIDDFYNDPNNYYCRYSVINNDDINILPCLKNGEKNILKNNFINTLSQLGTEVLNPTSKIFSENISLKSDIEIIQHNIQLRTSGTGFQYINDSRTMNMPKRSDLYIYIDERHDSQGRSLSFSYIYQFNGKDPHGNSVNENNFKVPYIAILDDAEYTSSREKREFIDFLIEINKILDKYEKYTNAFNESPTFSIIYWGDKSIEHIKELFLDVFQYLKLRGSNIHQLYSTLSGAEILEKKKDIGRLLDRFNSFFTSDSELEDYRVIEKNPFYNLKAAVEDVAAMNININNTLYEVNNKLSSEIKKPIYHKPDSDDFNGWIFSNVWKPWTSSVHRRNFITSLEKVLRDRLFCIFRVAINLDKKYFNGQAPSIPKLQRVQMFPGLDFGLDLYLLHKLDAAYELIEKENIHTIQVHKKAVLGKSVLLSKELIKSKNKFLKKHFGSQPFNQDEYKVYKINKKSIDANYDEQSFALTFYPVDKSNYIYLKFSPNNRSSCIYYDQTKDLVGINLFMHNPELGKATTKNYRQAVQVKIVKFERISGYIILKMERDSPQIVNFLESKHGFDFSNNVLLETTHVDTWASRLKECLARIETDTNAKNILEKYDPITVNTYTGSQVESILVKYYHGVPLPLDISQVDAIANILNHKLTLLWGPPGTGKSHTVAHLLLYYYSIIKNGNSKKVLIMGNYDATDNLIGSCVKLLDFNDVSIVRVKSKGRENGDFGTYSNLTYLDLEVNSDDPTYEPTRDGILKQLNKLQIFTSTPGQMLKVFKSRVRSFKFDLVIVDESSQMGLGHFVASLIKIHSGTQFLLAGDNLQLPPITNVKLKEPGKHIYGAVFDYYNNQFSLSNPLLRSELLYNRRSNRVIVDFSKYAFNYPAGYKADAGNENGRIDFNHTLNMANFYDRILNPDHPLVMLNYNDGNSSQLNVFEAEQVVEIVKNIWSKQLCEYGKPKVPYTLFGFFDKGIGIVVPHRAQRTKIQNMLIEYFNSLSVASTLTPKDRTLLREKIIASVDTVEKYQGQQREIMLCSLVLGDEDIIAQEEQFIYNPNRLNVMISRARFKAIVLASNELVSNVSNDIEVIDLQKSLQRLVIYCNQEEIVTEAAWKSKHGILKYKGF